MRSVNAEATFPKKQRGQTYCFIWQSVFLMLPTVCTVVLSACKQQQAKFFRLFLMQ